MPRFQVDVRVEYFSPMTFQAKDAADARRQAWETLAFLDTIRDSVRLSSERVTIAVTELKEAE